MKLREVTQETKEKYLNKVNSITQDYDEMIKAIDEKLKKFGLLHYQQTKNVLNVNYVKDQKEILKAEIKNINKSALDQIVAKLKDIKEKYIAEVTPRTAIKDELELSFIEKELKVMTDKELLDFYKENYLDTNITRLIEIEYKYRNGYKEGKVMMPLPEYGVEDFVTNRIDHEIKTVINLRQITGSMCCLEVPADELGNIKPVMLAWDNIFNQVEVRNLSNFIKVGLADFIKL